MIFKNFLKKKYSITTQAKFLVNLQSSIFKLLLSALMKMTPPPFESFKYKYKTKYTIV
jgi:hypothetical protein